VGDDAREVAGENTPTPDSFSLENSESSNPESSPNPLLSSSVPPAESCELVLLSSVGDSGEEEEVSSMRIEGMMSLETGGLSVVDALAISTTPSVRAITYEVMSSIPRTTTGKISRNARTRKVDETLATHDEES